MEKILKIGVCDDNTFIHEEMKEIILGYAKEKTCTLEIICYSSGRELLESGDIVSLDILFLDIDMPGLDGIDTAYRMKNTTHTCKIIMLTSKVERFKEAFKIGAFRFVTKPIVKSEVFEVIDDVCTHMVGREELTLYRNGCAYVILQRDISYLMVDKTSVYIYTVNNEFRSEMPLLTWEEQLDQRLFVRCHKSCIVNLDRIADVNKGNIRLVTGEQLPIARRRAKEVEQRLIAYDTQYR